MPLQLGNWRINSSGFEGTLFIGSVDAAGHVNGALMLVGGGGISGFWNEVTQELVFSPIGAGVGNIMPILYKGYLFSTPVILQPGEDFTWTLAGYFQMLDPGETHIANVPTPSSRHNTFGWFAEIKAIV